MASSNQLSHSEVQYLIPYFFNNGYPKHLILSCVQNSYVKNMTIHQTLPLIIMYKNFNSLPHFGEQYQKLKIELTALLTSYFSVFKFHIILINNKHNWKQFSLQRQTSTAHALFDCLQMVLPTSRNLRSRAIEQSGVSCRTGVRHSLISGNMHVWCSGEHK